MRELQDAVRSFLEQQAPVRAQLADDGGATWKRLSQELGVHALAVAEADGGAGATFVEVAAVVEEAGRSLLRAPLLSTLVAGAVLQHVGATDLLARLSDGSATAAVAVDDGSVRAATPDPGATDGRVTLDGTLPQVVDAPGATLLLVCTTDGLFVVEDAPVTALTPLDSTRPQGRVDLDGTSARRVGDGAAASYAVDLLHVALAAECVGAARKVLEMTVEHLKVREQFGRPLGSFQALRHRVADLTVELEAATSTAWYAARAAAGETDDLAVVAPLAKAVAAEAFVHVAGESIQLHGGIGFTWEHDCHLFFKRAWTTALLHGTSRELKRTAFERAGHA